MTIELGIAKHHATNLSCCACLRLGGLSWVGRPNALITSPKYPVFGAFSPENVC